LSAELNSAREHSRTASWSRASAPAASQPSFVRARQADRKPILTTVTRLWSGVREVGYDGGMPGLWRPFSQHELMKQEQWLVEYIDSAFAGVKLGDGRDLYAAQSADQYGNPDEDHLSLTAERLDWRRVPADDLFPRYDGVTFLDAHGFRFYAPAIMTALLLQPRPGECLYDWFLFNLRITKAGIIKGVHFNELFTSRQRAALIRFLKYLVYNREWPSLPDGDAASRLREIQTRTSPCPREG